jgi:hypothetical protein
MYGNHLADRAAANDASSLEPFDHTIISALKTGHILTYAQSQPYWYVANKSRIMTLDTITNAASEHEHQRYLQVRDDIRAKRGAPPKWTTGLSFKLAATQFETSKKHTNIGSAARGIRIVYDKYYQPWNIAKHAKKDDAICPECGEKDSLLHLLSSCTHPTYTQTRLHTYASLQKYVNTLDTNNLEYFVGNCLLKFVKQPDNTNTWTGLWTIEQRRTLIRMIESHPRYRGNAQQYGHKWAKVAEKILIGIGYGARQLIRHRHTKDEPLHGVGERLAALLKKAKEDTQKKQTKNKKVRLAKVEKISNRTRTLIGNFVALPPPPPESPPPQPPP